MSPKLRRDISGMELIAALGRLGYARVRQEGSHIRLRTDENGEHHITVPNHSSIKIGTLNSLLKAVATHLGIGRSELIARLRL